MHVLAIYDVKENKQELAGVLAKVLNVTLFETNSRLRTSGKGPFVVGVFAAEVQATKLADELKSRGFSTVVLNNDEIKVEADQWLVRKFDFGEKDLIVKSNDGRSLTIAYHDIELILHGMGIFSRTSMEATSKRTMSLGNAVLTGGLNITKTTKITHEITREERERFLTLYAGGLPTLAFHETGLVYDSLGQARGLSRSVNFGHLTAELRRLCTGAQYDERLLSKAGQTALLGPLLKPEEYMSIATALLAKVFLKKTDTTELL
jgi:hypothetical protein